MNLVLETTQPGEYSRGVPILEDPGCLLDQPLTEAQLRKELTLCQTDAREVIILLNTRRSWNGCYQPLAQILQDYPALQILSGCSTLERRQFNTRYRLLRSDDVSFQFFAELDAHYLDKRLLSVATSESWRDRLPCRRALAYLQGFGYPLPALLELLRWVGHPQRHWTPRHHATFPVRIRKMARELVDATGKKDRLFMALTGLHAAAIASLESHSAFNAKDVVAMEAAYHTDTKGQTLTVIYTILALLLFDWIATSTHPEYFNEQIFALYRDARKHYTEA